MTEPLAEVLRRTADDVPVPPAPARAVLAEGRARRSRRRVARTGAVVGACLVVAVVAVALDAFPRHPHQDRGTSTVSRVPTTYVGATFAIGSTVYSDDGRLRVRLPDDAAVRSLSYTSAGIVVRQQDPGGGPDRLGLVTPDNGFRMVAHTPRGTSISTDPHQPYLAYAEVVRGVVGVRVADVRTDTAVADVRVPGATPRADETGAGALPVALDGDLVYVGTGDTTWVVDWRTGAVSSDDLLGGGVPIVRGGAAAVEATGRGNRRAVVDATTGDLLVRLDDGSVHLSPSGRYAAGSGTGEFGGGASVPVHDLASGAITTVSLGTDWGWGPDDTLFSVTGHTLRTCAPGTGRCTEHELRLGQPAPTGALVVAGTDTP